MDISRLVLVEDSNMGIEKKATDLEAHCCAEMITKIPDGKNV